MGDEKGEGVEILDGWNGCGYVDGCGYDGDDVSDDGGSEDDDDDDDVEEAARFERSASAGAFL